MNSNKAEDSDGFRSVFGRILARDDEGRITDAAIEGGTFAVGPNEYETRLIGNRQKEIPNE